MDIRFSECVRVRVRSDGIYEYMKRQTGPDSLHLKTDEDLQAFINNYDASIIGMMSPGFPRTDTHAHRFFSEFVSGVFNDTVSHNEITSCVPSGVFSGADSSRLAEFLRASSLLREQFRFAHTTDLKLGGQYGVNSE